MLFITPRPGQERSNDRGALRNHPVLEPGRLDLREPALFFCDLLSFRQRAIVPGIAGKCFEILSRSEIFHLAARCGCFLPHWRSRNPPSLKLVRLDMLRMFTGRLKETRSLIGLHKDCCNLSRLAEKVTGLSFPSVALSPRAFALLSMGSSTGRIIPPDSPADWSGSAKQSTRQ